MRRWFDRLRISELSRRDESPTRAWETIGWWETRRIPYNLIVGTTGVVTCIVLALVAAIAGIVFGVQDFGLPDPPLFAAFEVLLYGIAANLFYTGGWIAELVIRKLWPKEADRFATSSFFFGLLFSIVVTLAPAIIVCGAGLLFLARRLLHT